MAFSEFLDFVVNVSSIPVNRGKCFNKELIPPDYDMKQ